MRKVLNRRTRGSRSYKSNNNPESNKDKETKQEPGSMSESEDIKEGSSPKDTTEDVGGQSTSHGASAGEPSAESHGACGRSERPNTLNDVLKLEGVDQMYAIQPLPWCAHLADIKPVPRESLDHQSLCEDCAETQENWVCLICYKVYCSRFRNEHMLFHGIESEHKMVLSYSDISVWCYACDNYIDNEILYPMKNAAHKSKFGKDIRS